MVVAEPATGVVTGADTVASNRAQMKSVYWLALASFAVLPLIAYSFCGPRWGFLASFALGGAALLPAIAMLIAVVVGMLIARIHTSRTLSTRGQSKEAHE